MNDKNIEAKIHIKIIKISSQMSLNFIRNGSKKQSGMPHLVPDILAHFSEENPGEHHSFLDWEQMKSKTLVEELACKMFKKWIFSRTNFVFKKGLKTTTI